MSFLEILIDERFLAHRRRSTSIAGMIGAATAILLFAYRSYFDHVVSWDLLSVALAFVIVKIALVTWYLFND